jgi:hypothetical protein
MRAAARPFMTSREWEEKELPMLFKKLSQVAVVMALALACARARAAGVDLPASAVSGETFAVAKLDVSKMAPAALEAAAKTVMGANAAMAQGAIDKYKAQYEDYAKSAESATFVMSGDPNQDKNIQPVVYVKLKPGSDHAAVEKKIREDQAKNGKGEEMDISHEGDFVVMRKKGSVAPSGGGDAGRASGFADVLNKSDKAFTVAVLPTEKVRAKMKADAKGDPNQPAWATTLANNVADSKWMKLELSFGDAPAIGVAVQAADDAGATGIVGAVGEGTKMMRDQAGQLKQAGPQFAAMGDALNALADALNPNQSGSQVSVNVEGKTIGPIIAQIMPMLMGAGGGQPRPAGGGL